MRVVDIIVKKRDGGDLTKEEIEFFIQGYTRGDIPDYQAAAWAMAVYLRGMSHRETIDLTLAMAHSGEILDLHQAVPFVMDKHSTGGVGDKTTIVVAPLVASCGLPVGKMSGRGLGFSGGTLDKLEAIRGYKVPLSIEEFLAQLRDHGIVVAGQTADLAPADGKLYALRDVTATVASLPLIAGSVMSKKIASGADAIVLDVKVGKGAFMQTVEDAVALARIMVEIGQGVGRRVGAVISDMNQPLGCAVGNALETAEAMETLRGRGPADFVEHCLVVAEQMLILGGKAEDAETARRILISALESGRAWDKFVEWITAQGGDPSVLTDPPDLPRARLIKDVPAPHSGYVAGLDARRVALAAVLLGAGREKKDDSIDQAVGIVLAAKVGDRVEQGQTLLTIHANGERRLAEAREHLLAAYTWSDLPVQGPPLVHQIIVS
ncbi:MAG: pyrimidine-nucleoside phosphorylase [Chloroflexota bacterium]|nr:pyrimidine-nucleoside phosphorylase [Chloroflexota bacterium]